MEVVKYYYTKPIFFFKAASFKLDGIDQVSALKPYSCGKRMTMAAIYNNETNEVRIGLSICHESDKFVKKVGQRLSEKQARESPIMIISHFSGKFKDFLSLVRHTGHMEERKFFNKYYKNYVKSIVNC